MSNIPSQPNQTVHEIVSIGDLLYDDWLDIYQKSFPLNEQLLISEHNKSLRTSGLIGDRNDLFLVSLDSDQRVTGIARVSMEPEFDSAALWYLAIDPGRRSSGLGTWLYGEVVKLVQARGALKALVFEVELPEHCETNTGQELARSRIAFYRRCGAKLFGGIHYMQSVKWQPEIPMSVMIHPFVELSPNDALTLAEKVLGEEIERIGDVTLS